MDSRLQVKMNSPDSARDVSIKQEEPEVISFKQEEPEDISIKQEPENHPNIGEFHVICLCFLFLLCFRTVSQYYIFMTVIIYLYVDIVKRFHC